MKKDIHPEYKEVVFLDMSTGKKFLCKSTVKTHETVDFEGKKYPCLKVSISSDSHPFYTGDKTFVDTEGRVDKFKKRYAKAMEVAPPKVEQKAVEEKPIKGAKKAAKLTVEEAPVKSAAKATPAKKSSAKTKEPKA